MTGIVWSFIVVIIAMWILGSAMHVGGALIHVLLVVAIALVIYNIFWGRGAQRS